MTTETPKTRDIADIPLKVEQLRREGMCIFQADDSRHWTLKEDAGPLATIGGFHTRSNEAFGGHIPADYADLFTAAPALLKALERFQRFARDNNWTDEDFHDADGTGWISDMNAAIEAARKHQRQGEHMRRLMAETPLIEREFPGFVVPVDIPAGFEDTSWHNDACPSFTNEDRRLKIWIDFENPHHRECGPDGPRFLLVRYWPDHSEEEEVANTDDWQDIIDALDEDAADNGQFGMGA